MIRINLLKKAVKKRTQKIEIPPKVWGGAAAVVAGLCIIVAAGWLLKTFLRHKPEKQYSVEEKLKPSTFSKAHAVEEVVDERDDVGDKLKRSGVLEFSYDELSPPERINYEIYFAKSVCDLLTETVPQGVGFRTLAASGFREIRGVTLTASRELLTNMLNGMRRAKVEPLPPPQSVVRPEGKGFQFTFVARTQFGLNLAAPFVDGGLGHLVSRDDLEYKTKELVRIAQKQGVRVTRQPQRLSADAEGKFRRFRYSFSAVSSWPQFVRFVDALHEERIPCAFEEFRLVAQTPQRLTIEAKLLFTTIR